MTLALVLAGVAAAAWMIVLLLPSRPWSTRPSIEPGDADDETLATVTVLIPARNEGEHLGETIAALSRQGRDLEVVVINDQSTDATAEVAASAAARHKNTLRVEIVAGAALPAGWNGKLWALEQGLGRLRRPWTLLLDADIEMAPGLIAALLAQARKTDSALVSVMATLRCVSFWERLLVPAFVYFFKLIYPFSNVASRRRRTAAAAGGCILVRTEVLREVGAFASIRGALIDDCTLAAAVKGAGHGLWLGLSHAVVSRRRYDGLAVFARMIARTAFTQLRYSGALLVGVTLLMVIVFAGPFAGLALGGDWVAVSLATAGLAGMCATYLPMVRWYSLSAVWAATLPLVAVLYVGMTWMSAIGYWTGTRAKWKDRAYASD